MSTQVFAEEIAHLKRIFPQAVIAYALRLGGTANNQRRDEIVKYLQSQSHHYEQYQKTRVHFERTVIGTLKDVSRAYSSSSEKSQGTEDQSILGNLEEHFS